MKEQQNGHPRQKEKKINEKDQSKDRSQQNNAKQFELQREQLQREQYQLSSSSPYELVLMQKKILSRTIIADLTPNKPFLQFHFKITIWLLVIVLFLKILPSPLIIKTFQNQPSIFKKQLCQQDECKQIQQGYQSITIKKVNPLQRQLKYFIKLNHNKINQLTQIFQSKKIDINKQITWIEIYSLRNNQIYGDVLYQKNGDDTYQIIFNNQPLIYIGQVHILADSSYLLKIYKIIHKYVVKNSGNNHEVNSTNQEEIKQISVPLTIELVRYSQFFTGTELLIRYVTFLFILYVRAQTSKSPKIFQAIMIFTANPLIFTQIAFPNTASNILSNMCSSMYLLYIPIFLFYTHRRLPNPYLDLSIRLLKLLAALGLYIASIIRSLHLINQTFVETIQYLLTVCIMIPIIQYLWRMYFIRSKVVLHRNMLFVVLTIYYFALLFFSGYVVDYGWKKISFYLIVQSYGVALCYLTSPAKAQPNPNPNTSNALSPNPKLTDHPSINSNIINSLQVDPSPTYQNQKNKPQLYIEAHFVTIF